MTTAKPQPLLVIDGDSFAHRAYHGLPKTIRRTGNRGGGAIVGFANYLVRLYAEESPRAVVVGWDTLSSPNWRAKEFADYQGGRVYDDEIVDQLDILPEFVSACGFVNGKAAEFEADDFLATAAAAEEKRGGTVIVASGDRDAFQLVSDKTTVLHPVKMGEMARIDAAAVRERYGVEPHQVPDFIALRGDPSDKLPGARGIGAKTAASLLKRYPDLETMLAAGQFPAQADDLRLYLRIATMVTTAPLPPIPDATPTWPKAAALARDWGLTTLAERLDAMAKG
ncbi:MAG: 5'-3' exonuclease [Devosia sp.]